MTPLRFRSLPVALAATFAVLWTVPVDAQLYQVLPRRDSRLRKTQPASPSSTDASGPDTRITMEIFTGKEGVGIQAQEWETVFERAGLLVRIHAPFPGDKISIREKHFGKLREVFVVGELERNGTLVFPDRKFPRSESAAFEEWLRELKTYGAQGNPTGKALWGLSREQFDDLFHALAAPVDQEVANLAFDEAIRTLQLPAQYRFRLSVSAEKKLSTPGLKQQSRRLQLRGFSQGTALAMLLSQYGLGFRPNRTPSGKLELLGVRTEDDQQLWPVGWDPPEGTYPASIAPKLFQQTQVELKDQKLIDVLEAIADKTGTPVRVDFASIAARGLDLDSALVSASGQHMVWSQLLTRITSPSFLTPKIRTDEAKKPFVWITSMKNAPARFRRPARDKKGPDPASPARLPDLPDQ
jgi:hypothetical protein